MRIAFGPETLKRRTGDAAAVRTPASSGCLPDELDHPCAHLEPHVEALPATPTDDQANTATALRGAAGTGARDVAAGLGR